MTGEHWGQGMVTEKARSQRTQGPERFLLARRNRLLRLPARPRAPLMTGEHQQWRAAARLAARGLCALQSAGAVRPGQATGRCTGEQSSARDSSVAQREGAHDFQVSGEEIIDFPSEGAFKTLVQSEKAEMSISEDIFKDDFDQAEHFGRCPISIVRSCTP